MTPAYSEVTSSTMPKALVIGAGPEALLGIEPALASNRFRVDFLEKDAEPYIAIRQRRPIWSCSASPRTTKKRAR